MNKLLFTRWLRIFLPVSFFVVSVSAAEIEPRVVTPSSNNGPPSDAIVLFDGKDLSRWTNETGAEAKWKVANGFMEVVGGTGNIISKEEFADVQLHLEWASPEHPTGTGQS